MSACILALLLCAPQESQLEVPLIPNPVTESGVQQIERVMRSTGDDNLSSGARIEVPASIPLNVSVQCVIDGVSLEDVTKGSVFVRIYPTDKITVSDGVSFITRKPYLNLRGTCEGHYYLLFILHSGSKLTIIEREFDVK